MEVINTTSLRGRIYDFFTQRVVYHSIMWLFLLLFLLLINGMNQGFFFTLTNQLVSLFFYAIIIYFNLFYLIPNYLTKKKFLNYSLLLIASVLVITPIKVMALYLKFTNYPAAQQELVNSLHYNFLVTYFIVGSSTIFKIVTDWVRHLRERQELQTQTMQSELRFLKSQINPHFLFNTLNNLYALTLKKDDKAPEIVIKLSEMMRYMLYECNEKQVMLSKEVQYIQNYLDLERLRQKKDVNINFEVQGNISDQRVAPLMFIPFLENSFKHGLNASIDRGFVNIYLNVENKEIDFFIENSKAPALPQISHKRSGGIGLVNVRRRLDILYPGRHELSVSDEPNTYGVNLNLELD
ncbi:MAG: sensor histidine kinase [Saprospiraceae bacterium]